MKKLALAFCLGCCLNAAAQKMASDYFNEANAALESKQYEAAIAGYQQVVARHPRSEYYPMAYFNLGYTYFTVKNYAQATSIFEALLGHDVNERNPTGGGIMADPYANYKHRANELLSEINYDTGNYPEALRYFNLATTTYPYLHFCGNAYAANDVFVALRYADIYQKLRQPEKSLAALLPAAFITLVDNSDVLKELRKLLAGRPQVKQELDAALQQVYGKETRTAGHHYTSYYFRFLGIELAVPQDPFALTPPVTDPASAAAAVKKTAFYQVVAHL